MVDVVIDEQAARALAEAEAKQVAPVIELGVELVRIDGGWQVRWVAPTSGPLIGVHRIIVDDRGTIHRFASSVPPRLAREQFTRSRAPRATDDA
jgi:hypothetical protein